MRISQLGLERERMLERPTWPGLAPGLTQEEGEEGEGGEREEREAGEVMVVCLLTLSVPMVPSISSIPNFNFCLFAV